LPRNNFVWHIEKALQLLIDDEGNSATRREALVEKKPEGSRREWRMATGRQGGFLLNWVKKEKGVGKIKI